MGAVYRKMTSMNKYTPNVNRGEEWMNLTMLQPLDGSQ